MIDFCNTTDAVKLENDLDLVVQQIDMLLDTDPHEVLGDPMYGNDFERFLWDLNYSNSQIELYINAQISSHVDFLEFGHNIKVNLIRGTENDIILVNISLFKDGYEFEKTYRIE